MVNGLSIRAVSYGEGLIPTKGTLIIKGIFGAVHTGHTEEFLAFMVSAYHCIESVLAADLATHVFLGQLKYLFRCDLF